MPTTFPTIPAGAILQFWDALPRDWQKLTEAFEYEDGGKDFNEVGDDPTRRWRYEVVIPAGTHTAAKAIADVYEAFFETVRFSQAFDFTDKYGTTWDNVYIETYERSHDANKSWIIFIKFQLAGFGSTAADVTSPYAPTDVVATPISSTSVLLSWTAAIDPDPSSDSTPPTVPTGLALSSRTTSSITIEWDASTD